MQKLVKLGVNLKTLPSNSQNYITPPSLVSPNGMPKLDFVYRNTGKNSNIKPVPSKVLNKFSQIQNTRHTKKSRSDLFAKIDM